MTVTALSADTVRTDSSSVEFADVRRAFGATRALDGLSLSIRPGELLALLGPSGCGKSTALRTVAGFETADSGRVLMDGADIADVAVHRRRVGMVFQSYSLFPHLTALDNVAFGLRMRGLDKARRRARAGELLDLVGLDHLADRVPREMSGGQQQRVALARALALEPKVLLLDEPLSALDAQVRHNLRDEIRRLQLELGITTLMVTHDQDEAFAMADRVGVMRAGRLEQVASPTELYRRPETAFVAEFVGKMSRLPGLLSDDGQAVEVLGGRRPVHAGVDTAHPRAVTVLVRPEELQLTADDAADSVITSATFLGASTRMNVALPGGAGDVLVDVTGTAASGLTAGSRVRVDIPAGPVLVGAR